MEGTLDRNRNSLYPLGYIWSDNKTRNSADTTKKNYFCNTSSRHENNPRAGKHPKKLKLSFSSSFGPIITNEEEIAVLVGIYLRYMD